MTALDGLCGWLKSAALRTVLHRNCEKSGYVTRRDALIPRQEGAPQAACFQRPDMGWFRDARIFVEGLHAGARSPVVQALSQAAGSEDAGNVNLRFVAARKAGKPRDFLQALVSCSLA